MNLVFTKKFVRQYRKLPKKIQQTTDKQLRLLILGSQYPSLGIKKMQDSREIWEGRISDSYRFTFQIRGGVYILRKIGIHDILKKP